MGALGYYLDMPGLNKGLPMNPAQLARTFGGMGQGTVEEVGGSDDDDDEDDPLKWLPQGQKAEDKRRMC